MKLLLIYFLFFLSSSLLAEEIVVHLTNGQVIKSCKKELDLQIIYCDSKKHSLVLVSYGSTYAVSDVNNSFEEFVQVEKITLEKEVVYKSPYESFDSSLGVPTQSFHFAPPRPSYLDDYEKASSVIFDLEGLLKFDQRSFELSSRFKKFINQSIQYVKSFRDSLPRLVNLKELEIELASGDRFQCKRAPLRKDILQNSDNECGAYLCGQDKSGNDIMFIKHPNSILYFMEVLTLSEKGILNSSPLKDVFLPGDTKPLFSKHIFHSEISADNSEEDDEDGDFSKISFIPKVIEEQSDFFNNNDFSGYLKAINESLELCEKISVKKYQESFLAHQKILDGVKLFQYIEDVNGFLNSLYLPQEKLPGGKCLENGIYYNPESYGIARRFSPEKEIKSITLDEAQKLFDVAKQMKEITWDFVVDGCYARAHLMARKFEEIGVHVQKAWLGGNLVFDMKNGESLDWRFHVAPVVDVKLTSGEVVKMVIDPAVNDKPVPVIEWAQKLTPENSKIDQTSYPFPQNATSFYRNALAISNSDAYFDSDPPDMTEEIKMIHAIDEMNYFKGFQ